MSESDIQELINGLAAKDGMARQQARHHLESMGSAAEGTLIDALGNEQELVRWEAAKALTRVATGRSAEALVTRLGDDNTGIRWLAAEALVRTGADGVEVLLVALKQTSDQTEVDPTALREGAHHVFHAQQDKALRELVAPVVEALGTSAANDAMPLAASAALSALRSTRS